MPACQGPATTGLTTDAFDKSNSRQRLRCSLVIVLRLCGGFRSIHGSISHRHGNRRRHLYGIGGSRGCRYDCERRGRRGRSRDRQSGGLSIMAGLLNVGRPTFNRTTFSSSLSHPVSIVDIFLQHAPGQRVMTSSKSTNAFLFRPILPCYFGHRPERCMPIAALPRKFVVTYQEKS